MASPYLEARIEGRRLGDRARDLAIGSAINYLFLLTKDNA